MPRLGMIGGIGPESTIEYYRGILAAWSATGRLRAPSIVINSIDVARVLRLAGSDRRKLADYLLAELGRLAQAGVDFAVLAANTPHIVFDELAQAAPMPLLSIVEATAAAAHARGLTRLAIFGTRFTMTADFYPLVCGRRGISVVRPAPADLEWIHAKYTNELLQGVFRPETRDGFAAVASRLHTGNAIDGVILGGTELPLLLRSATLGGVPALDTTAIHIRAIVARMEALGGASESSDAE